MEIGKLIFDNNEKDEDIMINDILKELEDRKTNNSWQKPYLSGFRELDIRTNGFKEGQVTVIASRTSIGKSTFIVNLVHNIIKTHEFPVLMVNLQTDNERWLLKLISAATEIKTKNHKALIDKINDESMKWLKDAKLYLTNKEKLFQIKHSVEKINKENCGPVGIIFIDGLEDLRPDMGVDYANREEMLGNRIESLKALSKKFKCPVVVTTQLSRKLESRLDKRPLLSDIQDSGRIEEVADIVLTLYRDEYYYHDITRHKNTMEVIIAKNNSGELETVKLFADMSTSKIRSFKDDEIKTVEVEDNLFGE
jgi:replicative DNA helicase